MGLLNKKKNKPKATACKTKNKTNKTTASKTTTTNKKQPTKRSNTTAKKAKKELPKNFPFWARLKIGKKRTTLVIDEEKTVNKKTKKVEDGFVHREATHTYRKDYEKIVPNPDKDDKEPMYLKRPAKKPKRLFEPHNKKLDMPNDLQERYSKNNKK